MNKTKRPLKSWRQTIFLSCCLSLFTFTKSFNFTIEFPLKLNRTIKKVYQKIELTFNFKKEIHVKIIRNKKKSTLKLGPKNTLQDRQVGDHFKKSHRSNVILKIVGATPQLIQNLTPIRKLLCTFLYQCCYYPRHPL